MADFARQYMLSNLEDTSDITASVASRIENKTLKFADFIASVQEYAVDDDLTIQAKSIGYISAVLALFKPDTLSRMEISVLVSFLRTRIEDNAGVKEAALGLRTLLEMTRFMKKDVVDIVDTIFKNIADLQRQPAVSRFAIYHLVEKSLEKCREALEDISGRFIDGVLSLAEFEKEPRNLMVVFSFLRVIMAEFPATERQTEALWDAVFRYYPITFNPKPGDKIQITKQDLQRRLEACITSNSRFTPFAFPSLLAKLDQEISATVKIETLKTISACIMASSRPSVGLYAAQMFGSIKYDSYSETDTALEGAEVLKNIFNRVFVEEDDIQKQSSLLEYAAKEIKDFMTTPTAQTSRKACILVKAVGHGSQLAFSSLLQLVMPTLMTIWQDADGKVEAMEALLKLFNQMLDDLNYCTDSTEQLPPGQLTRHSNSSYISNLENFKERLVELYDISLRHQESSIQILAVKGLIKFVLIRSFLSYAELSIIVQSLCATMLSKDCKDELRTESINGLVQISRITAIEFPNLSVDTQDSQGHVGAALIKSIVFPEILAAVSDDALLSDDYQHQVDVYKIWAKISIDVKVFEDFLMAMIKRLESGLKSPNLETARIILYFIRSGLEGHILHIRKFSGSLKFPLNNSPVDYLRVVKALFNLIITFDEQEFSIKPRQFSSTISLDDSGFADVGYIAMLVCRSVEAYQKDAASEVFTLFVSREEGSVFSNVKDQLSRGSALLHTSGEYRRPMILSKFLLASLRPNSKALMTFKLQDITGKIIEATESGKLASDSLHVKIAYAEILSILVNKFGVKSRTIDSGEDEPLDTVFRSALVKCFDQKNSMDIHQATSIIGLVIQYALAIVKKGDDEIYLPKSNDGDDKPSFLTFLISFLNVNAYTDMSVAGSYSGGYLLARAMGLLLDDSMTLLKKANHALVSQSYQKKFYHHFFPAIASFFESHQDSPRTQENCLVALTGVINHISGKDFVFESNPITLMLRVLDMNVPSKSKEAALDLMTAAARSHPELLSSHYKSVMNRLLTCIEPGDMYVQAKALRCTASLAESFGAQVNLSYKPKVLKTLRQALGDPVPEVRTEAVDCAALWSKIDEPSDD